MTRIWARSCSRSCLGGAKGWPARQLGDTSLYIIILIIIIPQNASIFSHHMPELISDHVDRSKAGQRVMALFINASVSCQGNGAWVARKAPVESLIAPSRSIVTNNGLVIIAKNSAICDLLDSRQQGRVKLELHVHSTGNRHGAFSCLEDFAIPCPYCFYMDSLIAC